MNSKHVLNRCVRRSLLRTLSAMLAVCLLAPCFSVHAAEYRETEDTADFHNLSSEFAVLVNVDTGEITAQKNADEMMYPASMTKIMTVLVAAEEIKRNGINLSDTVEITQDILDYVSEYQGTAVGFVLHERPTIMDLLWGTALPSGADAALALARFIAGTEEEFVEMMNDKARSMGLEHTHFENPVGMYADDHYTTPLEMAVILEEATENELAWAVLSTQQYTTVRTRQHQDGITVHNRFLKRLSRQNVPGIVFSAKTGYVSKAGSCAASFFVSNDETRYICVTGKAANTWQCIFDQAAIYRVYCTPEEEEEEIQEEASSEEDEGAESRESGGESPDGSSEKDKKEQSSSQKASTLKNDDEALEKAAEESSKAPANVGASDKEWQDN